MDGSVNKVTLVGRLTEDPKAKRTAGGQLMVNMVVVTKNVWRDRGRGQRREKAEFHRVTIFPEGLAKLASTWSW